jgi:endonuclease-3
MDRETAERVYRILGETYPQSGENPRHRLPPFQALIVTILSAQTTDRSVDKVSGDLFARFPTPGALANAPLEEVEEIIHATGFFHMKARHIIGASAKLVADYGGKVPDTMDELLTLPGVGRKTANIVLYHAFGRKEGIAVDTHVFRLSRRIGMSGGSDQDRVEKDLIELYPRDQWGVLTDLLIAHGRTICTAKSPKCPVCPINRYCRYYHETYRADGRK